MTTQYVAPAPDLPTQPPAPPAPSSSGTSKIIAILVGALGVAVALGAVIAATISTVASASTETTNTALDVSGITDLDVDASAGSLDIEFADVSEATLEVTAGAGRGTWTFLTEEDTLEVSSPRGWFGGWGWLSGPSAATLTLPERFDGRLDADLELSAGNLTVDGSFGELDLTVSAGMLVVDGSARDVSVDVSAGNADVRLDGVTEAEFSLSAGSIDARIDGPAPDLVGIDVSAGNLDLTLPAEAYDVRISESAGGVDSSLETSSSSRHVVTVDVSAGGVTLRPGR